MFFGVSVYFCTFILFIIKLHINSGCSLLCGGVYIAQCDNKASARSVIFSSLVKPAEEPHQFLYDRQFLFFLGQLTQ